MTLAFVAFHLNLTAFALLGPPPPMCVLGKEVRSVGVFRTPKRHGNFLHHARRGSIGGGAGEQDDLLRHSSTAQESAPLHPTARFANSVTAPSRTFSDATLQPSAHSAAGFCSRCHRRQVLQFAAPARAEHKFSRQGQTMFQHPRNEPFFTPHQHCSHIGVGGQLNSAD